MKESIVVLKKVTAFFKKKKWRKSNLTRVFINFQTILGHTCRNQCIYYDKRNCQGTCTKEIGHENIQDDEIHLCGAKYHYCGKPCSLITEEYECKNTCIVSHDHLL